VNAFTGSQPKSKTMKKIGIIGGMGPEATAAFYSGIFRIFQKRFGARYDDDYPEIIMISLPLPDVVECRGDESAIVSMLTEAAERLQSAGAEFIAIPCNTACRYLRCIEKAVSIPVLDIVEETAKRIKAGPYKRIGLLATKATIKSGIYEKCLEKYGMSIVFLGENMQEEITDIIMTILSGKKRDEDRNRLIEIIDYLAGNGADAVVLGCTDLPLLISGYTGKIRVFNTLKILSESVVENATGKA